MRCGRGTVPLALVIHGHGVAGGPMHAVCCSCSTGHGRGRCVQGKVRAAPKAQLSESTVAAIRRRWVDVLEAATGCATYGDFRKRINAVLGRPF